MGDFISWIKNKLFNIHDTVTKRSLDEKNISHYLFTYDLVEYNFKEVYESFNISYFTKNNSLINEWYDVDELMDYEKNETDYSILIKKFKFRVSIENNYNFSNDIIVCDDFNFDINTLKHADSLIKIALVKGDVSSWIKSGTLNNYDIIFTINKENQDLIKESFSEVFIVNGESVYLRLKNILNFLYMSKKEKFYYFINNKFNYTFPKMKNYFKILNSEFFDEEWYNNVYNIPDNTDCVIHYLLIGYKKGYNPGPVFDSFDYYELNLDIKQADLNPLVHYEKFGRKENRQYRIPKEELEKQLSFITDSKYFDEKWYCETYNISKEENPSKHYLKLGFKQGCNPGPNFDNEEYYECNLDVKAAGINPLLHYEEYGKEECRTIYVADIPKRNYYLISHSPYFNKEWYETTYKLSKEIDSADNYLNIGFKKGYNPGPSFNTNEYYENHPDAKKEMNPLLHYELYVRYSE